MYAEADHLLAKLNLRFKSDKLVGELSIGDQQMVEIAKVLSFESKVIIMDEPTDALTDTETDSLFRVIRELKSQGRGIVHISHRMKEIFEICDDVTVFRDGQFIAEREVATLTEDSLIEMMVGRKLEDQYPHLDNAPGEIRLKVDNLCGPGVNDVSLCCERRDSWHLRPDGRRSHRADESIVRRDAANQRLCDARWTRSGDALSAGRAGQWHRLYL